ncbi:MAG TPA: helix-turn-helix domain-containing protein [Mycobacterium sp.]|nr:helix-turn-helix domain-containing protein [Mycobacterium sp.]
MNIDAGHGVDALAALSSLDDPVRRRLYEYVASCDEPVGRDDAAAAVGIGRTLAAYHLDKLADAGVLTVSYSRPPGRSGPGAGRPAKQYSRTQQELLASVPPRHYELLAELLADAIATDDSGTVRATVAAAAYKAGQASASESTDLLDALRSCGYEPAQTTDGQMELRNCPFHQLAHQYTELVCGVNLNLIQGILKAVGDRPQRAVLTPREGRCCVVVRAPRRSRKKR